MSSAKPSGGGGRGRNGEALRPRSSPGLCGTYAGTAAADDAAAAGGELVVNAGTARGAAKRAFSRAPESRGLVCTDMKAAAARRAVHAEGHHQRVRARRKEGNKNLE